MRVALPVTLALLSIATGCEPGALDETAAPEPMTHTFPAIDVGAFAENKGLCQSWTLGNDDPLFVNTVVMSAGPGWHHSNWTYVTDDLYDGPDGTWDCDERDYQEFEAGAQGGVLFAQSTQSTGETQAFPAGTALMLPARTRLVTTPHLVNASDTPLSTDITLTLVPIAEDDAVTRLRPMALTYLPLDIPPQALSQFGGSCDAYSANNDQPLDFAVHYMLPHYHQWGTGMYLRANGPNGVIDIFDEDHTTAEGDGWGRMIDPPIDLTGATSIDFGCRYHNTTDSPLQWANSADGEMCVTLAYVNDNRKWVGGILEGPSMVTGTDGDGRILYESSCTIARLP